jgi:SpoVK/Ycf46/Vps4 family AAA+-type ATPase
MEPHDTDLALNYGDSFPEFHEKLANSLNEDKSGLYLFYGAPGTGKSSYIKYLLSGNLNRKIAYIPVGLIDKLVSPDMLPLLMENKDIILLIEDAEKALLSREESENSSLVSTILNLTDGFIGQALNISVIATFNTAKDRIDAALLRKGRLKLSHEFRKLSVAESKKLAEHIGKDATDIDEELSLADIYHLEKTTGYTEPEKRVFGFGKS